MKIVFASNYFNHHQKPFCEEMYQRLGQGFVFISTSTMREERKSLGYSQDDRPEYVCLAYEGENQWEKALTLVDEADAVIAGSVPYSLIKKRIKEGKLVLWYSERPFKKKVSFLRKMYRSFRFHFRDFGSKNVYMLCASAYAAGDYASIGMYKKCTYKWGYFPDVKEYDMEELFSRKKDNTIMWCGRFIDCKHPGDAIRIASKLKEDGYNFHLNMIGTGVMEAEIKQLAEDLNLNDVVHFLGSMSPEQVRNYMEETGIYLFTSDRQEGWGAVLNESMNSGCAVVASHAIGSTPFLIHDNDNGLIYPSGNINILIEKVEYLLDNPEVQKSMGRAAYRTMNETWNARVATERIIELTTKILSGQKRPNLFVDGPCSFAPVLSEQWGELYEK